MATETAAGAAEGALSLVLPPMWQRIHVGQTLDTMLEIVASGEYERDFGPDATSENEKALSSVRAACEADGVVFAAVRVRADEQAVDVFTVAVPRDDGVTTVPAEKSASKAPRNENGKVVNLSGAPGISHSSLAESDGDESFFRTHVQIVTRVRPSGRGAIVTLASSAPDAGLLLESEAEEIAGSLRIERG